MTAPTRVLILAAGFGTRLGPTGERRPKALLELSGDAVRPIDVLIARVRELEGVDAVDVWTNERFRPQLEGWAGGQDAALPIRVHGNGARDPEARLGAIGDIAAYLEGHAPAGPLLVLAADNVFDGGLSELACTARDEVCVILHDVGSPEAVSRLASVEWASDGRIERLHEKDPAPTGTLAATALYGIPASALEEVPRYLAEGRSADSMGSLLEWWVPRRRVIGVLSRGSWIDVGTEEDLARARSWVASRA